MVGMKNSKCVTMNNIHSNQTKICDLLRYIICIRRWNSLYIYLFWKIHSSQLRQLLYKIITLLEFESEPEHEFTQQQIWKLNQERLECDLRVYSVSLDICYNSN